eukprot:Hpha_TRINITY_DN30173_c0_g1::TRINITY_DN30173_c0_g1_i1::g.110728::m.110728/K09458/fabF; 3-oxoacyl-[acyl-carrier-protein] synthase II
MRRVCVTGVGCVSPLGLDWKTTWSKLIAGDCGVRSLTEVKGFADGFPHASSQPDAMSCRVAASVPCGGAAELRADGRTTRYTRFALTAAAEAVRNAGLEEALEDEKVRSEAGVCVGVGIASLTDIAACTRSLDAGKLNHVSPFFVPKILGNTPAGQISIRYKLGGPCHSASTACATGAHSIGDAVRFIQMGDADIMLAGGTEACLNPVAFVGFQRLRALTVKHNEDPATASRPFDAGRGGFVMGEGAAVLVLEELERAKARGAEILAEVVGYGASGDGHHVTAPDPTGAGSRRSMQLALRHAARHPSGVNASKELSYVNAHATSTPLGDEIEASAIHSLAEGLDISSIPVSSTKGALGHLLGAAGAIEAAIAVGSVAERTAPHTLNLNDPPDGCSRVDFLRGEARGLRGDGPLLVMSNSFGFGGTNACLLFRSA